MTNVILTFNTFKDNFENNPNMEKYLKERC